MWTTQVEMSKRVRGLVVLIVGNLPFARDADNDIPQPFVCLVELKENRISPRQTAILIATPNDTFDTEFLSWNIRELAVHTRCASFFSETLTLIVLSVCLKCETNYFSGIWIFNHKNSVSEEAFRYLNTSVLSDAEKDCGKFGKMFSTMKINFKLILPVIRFGFSSSCSAYVPSRHRDESKLI